MTKLAGIRQITGTPQGAQPSLLSRTSGTVNINASAAALNPRTLQPTLVTASQASSIGTSVAELGKSVGKAAFLMADRIAEMESTDAANEYNAASRNIWLGHEDRNGNFLPGYASTTAKEGATLWPQFQKDLQDTRNSLAANLSDGAKVKFLAKSNGNHTALLNQGANHARGAQIQWEQEQLNTSKIQSFQGLDDKLTQLDLYGAEAVVKDHMAQAAASRYVNGDKIPEILQQYHREATSFLATTDQAPAKIQGYKDMFGSSFDLATASHINTLAKAAVKEENRIIKQAQVDAENTLSLVKKKNDLDWFKKSFSDPASLDITGGLSLVESGKLSPSVYLAARGRIENKDYLPTISAKEETLLKQALVDGTSNLQDVLELALYYDDASVRRLGNFAVQSEGYEKRADLRYGYERIERTIRSIKYGVTAEKEILSAQRNYEKLLTSNMGPEQALNQIINPYLQNVTSYEPMLIQFKSGSIIDLKAIGPDAGKAQLKKLVQNGSVTPQEAETAAGEILRYKRAQENKEK